MLTNNNYLLICSISEKLINAPPDPSREVEALHDIQQRPSEPFIMRVQNIFYRELNRRRGETLQKGKECRRGRFKRAVRGNNQCSQRNTQSTIGSKDSNSDITQK